MTLITFHGLSRMAAKAQGKAASVSFSPNEPALGLWPCAASLLSPPRTPPRRLSDAKNNFFDFPFETRALCVPQGAWPALFRPRASWCAALSSFWKTARKGMQSKSLTEWQQNCKERQRRSPSHSVPLRALLAHPSLLPPSPCSHTPRSQPPRSTNPRSVPCGRA